MILRHVFGFLIVFATWLIPASAEEFRAKKTVPPPSSAYQNKPIAVGAIVWYCAYDGNTDVSCRLREHDSMAATRPVQVIDARLPRLVHDIRNNPEQLADEDILIPLHSKPYTFDFVGELVESVMCRGGALCGVIFAETPLALSRLIDVFESTLLASNSARPADATNSAAEVDGRSNQAVDQRWPGVTAYSYASAR